MDEVVRAMVEDRKRKRGGFLVNLYRCSLGNPLAPISIDHVGAPIGFHLSESRELARDLQRDGLIVIESGSLIRIEPAGARLVEVWASGVPQTSPHITLKVMNVQSMEGSQVQLGTAGSSQTFGSGD